MVKTYIYGAGKLAHHTLELCKRSGVKIAGVVDPAKIDSKLQDFSVLGLSEIQRGSRVLISVLNNFVSVQELRKKLENAGAGEVLTPPEVFFEFGKLGIDSDWYWLSTNKRKVLEMAKEARHMLHPILDDLSNDTLEMILNYRCSGITNEKFIQQLESQYFETGIQDFWSGDVSLLDGGAFDGDTIISADKLNVKLRKVYAFEPDPINHLKLKANTHQYSFEIRTFQAGLSDENRMAYFNFTSNTGSTLVESPSLANTQLLRFDSLAPENEVTHIKLDVEGSEAKALNGMKDAITKFNPKMAISIYHRPEDIFEIPKLVISLGRYSKFSLRNYAYQSFETIFYAAAD
jgi:FkbM family methyltransferase